MAILGERARQPVPATGPAPRGPGPRRLGPGLARRLGIRGRDRPNWTAGAVVLLWFAFVGVPLYVLVKNSLQPRDVYLDGGPLSAPTDLTAHNFAEAVRRGMLGYALNTAVVTGASVALMLALAFPAAYAIVRSTSRLVGGMFLVFLAGLAIPAQATIIPVYLLITRMHLYDSLGAIILPTVAFGLPLSVLVLATALRDVPRELYEAMTLDGGGPARMLWSLAIPLSRAAMVTVSIYTALNAWNGFIFPLVLTQSESKRVVTLGLFNFTTEYGVDVPGVMAAVLLTALPIFLVYLFARRWLIAGLAGIGGK